MRLWIVVVLLTASAGCERRKRPAPTAIEEVATPVERPGASVTSSCTDVAPARPTANVHADGTCDTAASAVAPGPAR